MPDLTNYFILDGQRGHKNWPKDYLRQERLFCKLEQEDFDKALYTDLEDEAREAVLKRRNDFFEVWASQQKPPVVYRPE